jgi:hypothetical protein
VRSNTVRELKRLAAYDDFQTFRFMRPEEFILGAEIDEHSNVYTIGLMAFALLGGMLDRSFVKWRLERDFMRLL